LAIRVLPFFKFQQVSEYLHILEILIWKLCVFDTGLTDFLGTYNIPKLGNNIPNDLKITKRPQNIPYACKIFRIDIKYINIFHSKDFQNIPKLGFLEWNLATLVWYRPFEFWRRKVSFTYVIVLALKSVWSWKQFN
jgi:hypothetical protein